MNGDRSTGQTRRETRDKIGYVLLALLFMLDMPLHGQTAVSATRASFLTTVQQRLSTAPAFGASSGGGAGAGAAPSVQRTLFLQSPAPYTLSSTFVWAIGAVSSRPGPSVSSLALSGCWSPRQIVRASAALGVGRRRHTLRVGLDQRSGALTLGPLRPDDLPLALTVLFRARWRGAPTGARAVLRLGAYGTRAAALGGPLCQSRPLLLAPLVPAVSSTFVTSIEGVALAPGQQATSLTLQGCWSAGQVARLAADRRGLHPRVDQRSGSLVVDDLKHGQTLLPLTLVATYRTPFKSAAHGDRLVVHTVTVRVTHVRRQGRPLTQTTRTTKTLVFVLDGPACPVVQLPRHYPTPTPGQPTSALAAPAPRSSATPERLGSVPPPAPSTPAPSVTTAPSISATPVSAVAITLVPAATTVPTSTQAPIATTRQTVTNAPTATAVPGVGATPVPTNMTIPTPTATGSPTPTSAPTAPTATGTAVPDASATTAPTATTMPTATLTSTSTSTQAPTATVSPMPTSAPTATTVPGISTTPTPTATTRTALTPTTTPSATTTPMLTTAPASTSTQAPTATAVPGASATIAPSATIVSTTMPTPTSTSSPSPMGLPPDPASIAPHVDMSVATSLISATQFLYTGANPIQTGVISGTIDPLRVAVLRGQVLDAAGQPLPGVIVAVLDHPAFGQTLSRGDGRFDLVVNGGGALTVTYTKEGRLPAQRQAQTPPQDFVPVPDVALVKVDPRVTTIDLSSSQALQVAQGSPVNDVDGQRQATLLFAAGTQATMTRPDGSTQPLSTLHVRATEYTVGVNGLLAMPGALPPTSGYTYAADFSVDEALAAGATSVQFTQPVVFYVQNFLNFPVGLAVPVGSYDRQVGQWLAAPNGRVISILSVTDGKADLDVDGSGQPAGDAALAALGVTDAERAQLATLYQPGQSLWRTAITHFSPWDCNWPYGPPSDATPPNQPQPQQELPLSSPDDPPGFTLQNQTLSESLRLNGTPYDLHYESDRAPGHKTGDTVQVSVTGPTVPASLLRVEVEIDVAGEHFKRIFSPAPNQSFTFIWDRKDAYGRVLQAPQPVSVRLGYVYPAVYQTPARLQRSFAALSGVPLSGNRARREVTVWQAWRSTVTGVGAYDARGEGLGGWTLNVHHVYAPGVHVLYKGDGTQVGGQSQNSATALRIDTVAGSGVKGDGGDHGPATAASLNDPAAVAVGPDGALYIADTLNARVRRVGPQGTITTVAGTGTAGDGGDGGAATAASLNGPSGLAVGPDGALYIADTLNARVRRVGLDGIITTVAGTGVAGFGGDGGVATAAQLNNPTGVSVSRSGDLYIADALNARLRRVGPDGFISTVAGTGTRGGNGDGGAAPRAQLSQPEGVTVGPDGTIYIADSGNGTIRRIGPNGIISSVNANLNLLTADGRYRANVATGFTGYHMGVAVSADGYLFVSEGSYRQIVRVAPDDSVVRVAGTGVAGAAGFSGDGGAATAARLNNPMGVAIGPDGALYIADTANERVRRVASSLPNVSLTESAIASGDGAQLYIFNAAGRHLRTVDAVSGVVLYRFGYDASGRLVSLTDRDGNVTTIAREGGGNATAIVAPYGQTTRLSLDANGFLASVTDPLSQTTAFTVTPDGLLTERTDPQGRGYRFSYDDRGRLVQDRLPTGGVYTLARSEDAAHRYTVTLTTPTNQTSTYTVQDLSNGGQQRINTGPDGLGHGAVTSADGSSTQTEPDGTTITSVLGPDPRFGMQAPLVVLSRLSTPGGVAALSTYSQTLTLADPGNLLSVVDVTTTATLNGSTASTVYSGARRMSTRTSPQGRTSAIFYGDRDKVVEQQIPGVPSLRSTYDSRGRLSTTVQATRAYTYTYDDQGLLASVTDPLGQTQRFAHDAAGRVITQTLRDGRQVGFRYDASGNLTALTPPGRAAHTFTYNALDAQQDYVPPALSAAPAVTATHNTYNAEGQLTGVTRADGATIGLAYDSAGRPRTITTPEGQTTYGYDPATGHLSTITAPDGGALRYGYDGSLTTVVSATGVATGSVGYGYDNNLRLASESVNGAAAIGFSYDQDSVLTQAGALSLGHDPQNGRPISSTLGTVADALSYDTFGELARYDAQAGATGLLSDAYTYDPLGRITGKTETIGGVTHTDGYHYDVAGRLVEVDRDGASIGQYSYDANDNRTSVTTASGATTTSTYDARDRLMQAGGTTYASTVNGDIQSMTDKTTGAATTYSYDTPGALVKVILPNGTRIDYTLDGLHRRIGKQVDGIPVQGFLYGLNPLRPAAELDGAGAVVSRFVYAGNRGAPAYMVKGGAAYRLINDQLGSPRLVVDMATGQIVQRMDYDAFGAVITDTNPGFQPFGFAGGLYDRQTGLVHDGARDYDPRTGRWTARDPLLFDGGQTNLYVYAGDDPVNGRDANGLGGSVTVGGNGPDGGSGLGGLQSPGAPPIDPINPTDTTNTLHPGDRGASPQDVQQIIDAVKTASPSLNAADDAAQSDGGAFGFARISRIVQAVLTAEMLNPDGHGVSDQDVQNIIDASQPASPHLSASDGAAQLGVFASIERTVTAAANSLLK